MALMLLRQLARLHKAQVVWDGSVYVPIASNYIGRVLQAFGLETALLCASHSDEGVGHAGGEHQWPNNK